MYALYKLPCTGTICMRVISRREAVSACVCTYILIYYYIWFDHRGPWSRYGSGSQSVETQLLRSGRSVRRYIYIYTAAAMIAMAITEMITVTYTYYYGRRRRGSALWAHKCKSHSPVFGVHKVLR